MAKVFGVAGRWKSGDSDVYDSGFRGCFTTVISITHKISGVNNRIINSAKGANHGTRIHCIGRLSLARNQTVRPARRASVRTVRRVAQEIPAGTQADSVQQVVVIGGIIPPLCREIDEAARSRRKLEMSHSDIVRELVFE